MRNLEQIFGRSLTTLRNFQSFFSALKEEKVDNPGAKVKYISVLKRYMEKQDLEGWFETYADDLIINKE